MYLHWSDGCNDRTTCINGGRMGMVTKEWITEDDEEWVQEIFDGMGIGNGVEREGW